MPSIFSYRWTRKFMAGLCFTKWGLAHPFRWNSRLGLAHPFDCGQGRLFPRFLREDGSSARTRICMNARQTRPLSKPGLPAFHHVQLLWPHAAARFEGGERDLRANPGASPHLVRVLHRRICSHARARAPAAQRTGAVEIVSDDTDAEAGHVTKAARQTSAAVLAGPLLRFSGMERSQTHREAALHASQLGEARTGGEARGMEMEQLCSLCDGDGRDG